MMRIDSDAAGTTKCLDLSLLTLDMKYTLGMVYCHVVCTSESGS